MTLKCSLSVSLGWHLLWWVKLQCFNSVKTYFTASYYVHCHTRDREGKSPLTWESPWRSSRHYLLKFQTVISLVNTLCDGAVMVLLAFLLHDETMSLLWLNFHLNQPLFFFSPKVTVLIGKNDGETHLGLSVWQVCLENE